MTWVKAKSNNKIYPENIRNNLRKSWTQLLEGETLENLFNGVYGAVEMHKLDVW